MIAGTAAAVVTADEGYDSAAVVRAVEATGAGAVTPTREDRAARRATDRERYEDRNLVERFRGRIEQYRRVAARYEKTARNFLGFLHLASIVLLSEQPSPLYLPRRCPHGLGPHR